MHFLNSWTGATIGRFFGLHDDQSEWNPAGTLPPNRETLGYLRISRVDPNNNNDNNGDSMTVITPPENSPTQSPPEQRRERRNGRWGLGGFSNTIRNLRKKKDPTREEVMKTLPSFWPVMTVLIALIEVGMLIATIATGRLAPIRFTPETNTSTIRGFGGTSDFSSREILPNFFIGTSKASLIHAGAMYSPVSRIIYS